MSAGNPIIQLVDILFTLYIYVLMLRFLLQWTRADFYNPVSQFIVKISNPVVVPLRRIVPGMYGMDMATLCLIYGFIFIKLLLKSYLVFGNLVIVPAIGASFLEMIVLTFDVFIFAIFVMAILSWVNPDPRNPVMGILGSLTYPVLRPVRRLVKPVGGLDISPMIALIGLWFIKSAIVYFFHSL